MTVAEPQRSAAEHQEFIGAVRAGQIGAAVWGCGHIGASALFHLAVAGVRCFGFDVAADINKARDHPPADPNREVGPEAGLNLAGQCQRSLLAARLHNLGTH